MKILSIVVDGYGKLIGKKLDLKPGLQIIIGPNEQGKSTLRSFIADMLYGQKRSETRRSFEDSNTLREPWQGSGAYGGTLRYELEDGREIEVARNFHKDRESVQVFDRTHAKDITGNFEKLRNNEVGFATEHLGLSKEVFINAATISHLTLEDLGGADAMQHIREKLLSLADAGDDSHSADSVIQRLKERLVTIGQPNARTKPLPAARNRMLELQQELHAIKNLHHDLRDTEERRAVLVREIDALEQKRKELDAALGILQRHKDAERLDEAEALYATVGKLAKDMAETLPSKMVPLEGLDAMVQQANTIVTLRSQRVRTEEELRKQEAALAALKQGESAGFSAKPEDIPEALEKEYSEANSQIQRATEGIQERKQAAQGIEARYREFQQKLAEMPDFQRVAEDPVEYLNQLATSFYAAVRERDESIEERDKMRAEVENRREAIKEDHELFARVKNLTDMTREFELRKRMLQEQLRQQGSDLQTLRANHEEVADRVPGLALLSVFCVLFLGGLVGAYVAFENPAIFFAMGLAGVAILYFGGSLISSILQKRELEEQIKEIKKLLGPYGGADTEDEKERAQKEAGDKAKNDAEKSSGTPQEPDEKPDKEQEKPGAEAQENKEESGESADEDIHENTGENAEIVLEGVAPTVDAHEVKVDLAETQSLEEAPSEPATENETVLKEQPEPDGGIVEAPEKSEVSDSSSSDSDSDSEDEGDEEDEIQLREDEEEPVAKLLDASGCMTIRELEARYEKYREALSELHLHEAELAELETRTAECEAHVPQLMECLRQTFETQLKDSIADEEDVREAVKRCIGAYQEFRDIRRRGNDARQQYEKLDQEIRQRKHALETAQEKMKKADADIRAYIRERGFNEAAHDDLAAAVRGYRARLSELGELHGRVETLQKTVEDLQTRLTQENSALQSLEAEHQARLDAASVASLQEWKALADMLRQYQTLDARKTALEDQIRALLGGQDIDTLRRRVHSGGALPNRPLADEDTLKAQRETLEADLDARRKEEYALHLQLTERAAAARTLNEVEEETAAVEKQISRLNFEFEATNYAISHIEDIARDKHARIAPKLAERASGYLKAITNGAYSELLISRDMTISVRIPQTQRMHENPERSLSKGTVDQIYLALRLSLVQSMSDNGETIPMLLDDPFANYDDERLERTMKILVDIAQNNQVLLFTCREDVARAAETANAPVIRL